MVQLFGHTVSLTGDGSALWSMHRLDFVKLMALLGFFLVSSIVLLLKIKFCLNLLEDLTSVDRDEFSSSQGGLKGGTTYAGGRAVCTGPQVSDGLKTCSISDGRKTLFSL